MPPSDRIVDTEADEAQEGDEDQDEPEPKLNTLVQTILTIDYLKYRKLLEPMLAQYY